MIHVQQQTENARPRPDTLSIVTNALLRLAECAPCRPSLAKFRRRTSGQSSGFKAEKIPSRWSPSWPSPSCRRNLAAAIRGIAPRSVLHPYVSVARVPPLDQDSERCFGRCLTGTHVPVKNSIRPFVTEFGPRGMLAARVGPEPSSPQPGAVMTSASPGGYSLLVFLGLSRGQPPRQLAWNEVLSKDRALERQKAEVSGSVVFASSVPVPVKNSIRPAVTEFGRRGMLAARVGPEPSTAGQSMGPQQTDSCGAYGYSFCFRALR